jgi:hypothetical protein
VRYCAARKTRFKPWDISGAAHLRELHEKVTDAVLRRTKEECLDLPGKQRRTAQVSVSSARRAEYDEALRTSAASPALPPAFGRQLQTEAEADETD